jgi:hypothetical protein
MEKFTFEGCERPRVQLVGKDGNAFSILGRCQSAARKIWNEAQQKQFHDEATSDDYDHLLRTVAKYFDLIDPDDEEFDGY